jgi:hypothetical protein
MRIRTAVILLLTLGSTTIAHAQQAPTPYADEVIAKLMDHNSQRDKLGGGYTGTRRYVLENQHLNKQLSCVSGRAIRRNEAFRSCFGTGLELRE